MELRQQVILSRDEIKDILIAHISRQGLRIDPGSIQLPREMQFFGLTMTEEQIYEADTTVILEKSLSALFEASPIIKSGLQKKLIAHLGESATIGALLKIRDLKRTLEAFRKNNCLIGDLFTESESGKKDGLKRAEEDLLIEAFAVLGIRLNKR